MHEWGETEYYLHQVPAEIKMPTFQEVSEITGTIAEPGEQFVALMGIAQRVSSWRQHAAIKDEDYSRYVLGDEDTRAMRSGDNWPDSAVNTLQTLRGMKEERRWYKTLGNYVDNKLGTMLGEMDMREQQVRVEPFAGHAILTQIHTRRRHIGSTRNSEPKQGFVVALQFGQYRDARHYNDEGRPTGHLNFYSEQKNRFRRDRFFSHFAQVVDEKTGEPTAHVEFL